MRGQDRVYRRDARDIADLFADCMDIFSALEQLALCICTRPHELGIRGILVLGEAVHLDDAFKLMNKR